MNPTVAAYHDFVDALVARTECVLASRVRSGQVWPETSSLSKYNSLLEGLASAQREQVAELLQKAREGGIHDVLVELSERSHSVGLRIVQAGAELAHEPHGTELYFDWAARCSGEAWPHEG